jgi:hypothetical protein
MSVRQVSPADGSTGVTFGWDLSQMFLQSGTMLDVPPGSALEAAIGLANLTPLSGPELDSCQQGSAGAVSN